jgi:hypothetical protein
MRRCEMVVRYWTQSVWEKREEVEMYGCWEDALRAAGADGRLCAYSTALLEPVGVDALDMRRFVREGAEGLVEDALEMFMFLGRGAHVAAVKYRRTRLLTAVDAWRAYSPERAQGTWEDVDRQAKVYEHEAAEWLKHLRSL